MCSEHCRSLYAKRVEEIDSQIRYCTFMTGGSAADIDELLASSATDELDLLKEKFARVVEEQKKAKSDDLSSVEWLGRTEGVQSEALAMGLLKIQKKVASVADDALAADARISACVPSLATSAQTLVLKRLFCKASPAQTRALPPAGTTSCSGRTAR